MKLPSVIKVKGVKLVKTETPYDISYSTIVEARSVTISTAISKAVSEARKLEILLEKQYNVVYSGFNFLTKNRLGDEWLVVIEAMFTKRDYYPEMEGFDSINSTASYSESSGNESEAQAQTETKAQREVVRFTHFNLIDKLVILEVVDELEMILNKKPAIKDTVYMAKKYGLETPMRVINDLVEDGFLQIENLSVGRTEK